MSQTLRQFWTLLADFPAFRKIWLSHLASLLGDWLSYIAVAVLSISSGKGAVPVALVMVAHTVPTMLISPFAGILADRYDRRGLILISYLGAGLLTVGMWAASSLESIWLLQSVLFLRVAVSSLGLNARSAALPALVGRDNLHQANALLGLSWSVMFALGLALGGLVSSILSPAGAIALDASTFLVAAWIARGLPKLLPPTEKKQRGADSGGLDIVWQYVFKRPKLFAYVFAKTPATIVNAGAWVTLNLVAGERLTSLGTALALGMMQCTRALGTGVGPLLPTWVLPRNPFAGVLLMFVGIGIFAYFEPVWSSLVGLFLWGAGGGHNWVVATVCVQENSPDEMLGRISALDSLMFSMGSTVAALIAGFTCDYFGAPAAGTWVPMGLAFVVWIGVLFQYRRGITLEASQSNR